jgi:hypothetical protein
MEPQDVLKSIGNALSIIAAAMCLLGLLVAIAGIV